MLKGKYLKEMNTQAHRMAKELLLSLEDLIQQTNDSSMLERKLRSDQVEHEDVDHREVLAKLDLANKYLKLAHKFLAEVDQTVKTEVLR